VPLLVIPVALILALLLFTWLIPFSLVQRYRVGTSRRQARGWIITANLVAIVLSIGLFLAGAGVTSIWVPRALSSSIMGLLGGGLLGFVGLALTRWERSADAIHYTPNRWLVLGITLVVTVRLLYGLARTWQSWRLEGGDTSWLAAAGVAGSLAAGAVVLGYYLVYWFGIRWKLRRVRTYSR
jgi:hypothetical protein